MKKHILICLLAVCLLLSATALAASAVPTDSGNVGDSSGVVTSGADTGLLTSMTPTTTVAPVTTPAPATTSAPATTAPVTTGAPMADDEGTSVLGIVLAVLAAAAAVVLALVFIPKMKKR